MGKNEKFTSSISSEKCRECRQFFYGWNTNVWKNRVNIVPKTLFSSAYWSTERNSCVFSICFFSSYHGASYRRIHLRPGWYLQGFFVGYCTPFLYRSELTEIQFIISNFSTRPSQPTAIYFFSLWCYRFIFVFLHSFFFARTFPFRLLKWRQNLLCRWWIV